MTGEIAPDVIRIIHAEPEIDSKIVIALAGNGTQGVSELMRHGRGSATLLAQHLLNDPFGASMSRYLGGKPDKAVSEWTARQMAMTAYVEARHILGHGSPDNAQNSVPVGIASTGALVKPDGEREGRKHVFHVAVQTPTITRVTTYTLPSGHCREMEEWINGLAVMSLVAEARVPSNALVKAALDPIGYMHRHGIEFEHETVESVAPREASRVLHDHDDMAVLVGSPAILTRPYAVLSGSFNPLHDGHVQMAAIASKHLNLPVIFELSITNTDKPPIDYVEIRNRARQFEARGLPLVITNRPKFMDKSVIFAAGTVFVMGVDTYDRLGDAQYYKDGSQYTEAMQTFTDRYNCFIVFPRRLSTGQVKGAVDKGWGDPLFHRVIPISHEDFLVDLSSSELRKAGLR